MRVVRRRGRHISQGPPVRGSHLRSGPGLEARLEIFKEQHPDVTVDFQQTSFDAVRQNAKITLSGNEVPDVIEFNKGNADGGQLAAQACSPTSPKP
ncbi:extracellular solute-binding protein [Brachybacterium sacelli]|uniref:extracellular solute-binding protein n=1 Tax=Brachybacterium sacelli TaxID=173364 RepID=UPI0036095E0B